MRITGVILAGGANSRFEGKTKATMLIAGKPIVAGILDTMEGIFDEIILVTNTPESGLRIIVMLSLSPISFLRLVHLEGYMRL